MPWGALPRVSSYILARATRYGQVGCRLYPPFHGKVYRSALQIRDAAASIPSAVGTTRVRLLWTPYERILYLLWHVTVQVEYNGVTEACELPAASSGRSSAAGGDALVVTLDLPRSLRTLAELRGHQSARLSSRHGFYLPAVNDCRHHAIATLRFLYP